MNRLRAQILQPIENDWERHILKRFLPLVLAVFFLTIAVHAVMAQSNSTIARPKVILISLDGAAPYLINQYLAEGILSPNQGLGLLKSKGIVAQQNITCNPSLTAVCHTSIGSGSTAARNDVIANVFHLVASPFIQTISGFVAPIGGYSLGLRGPVPSPNPTAEPIWIKLRASGKKVVTATFPGADGMDVKVPGLSNSPIIQSAKTRTVDYTVPFGASAGARAQGFSLTRGNFSSAPQIVTEQLKAAGKLSYSPVLQASLNDKFTVGGADYDIQVAALDTTNDKATNYDTLVFFDANQGIKSGPFLLPATGPAYIRASDKVSSPFYLEGSSNKAGTGFYITYLAPDLSTVRLVRYSANYIPSTPSVQTTVDDINNNVGFWANQPDYRILEHITPGLNSFPETEVEAVFEDQVRLFIDYQTRIALQAIKKNPNADLVMVYIEQPDGSEHQFLITDLRQATNHRDPNTIGVGQDKAKVERYQKYVQAAYQVADQAVQRIIDAVGTDTQGKPNSNIIVVSDHGFATFHTSVDLNTYLKNKGFDLNKVRAITSGPAANIYINLKGREPNGIVTPQEYVMLQQQIINTLKELVETNPNYTLARKSIPIFDKIYSRPLPKDLNEPSFGLGTSKFIGQNSGDVFATLIEGYNFDGIQTPPVSRLEDTPTTTPVLSVSNFYGVHGYDPTIPHMSASFFAAGPDIGHGTLEQVHNIDVTPTIDQLLGVRPASTVEGKALPIKR